MTHMAYRMRIPRLARMTHPPPTMRTSSCFEVVNGLFLLFAAALAGFREVLRLAVATPIQARMHCIGVNQHVYHVGADDIGVNEASRYNLQTSIC